MRITIVGGGNIGTQFAVHCAEKGNEVIIYTSRPEAFRSHLKIVNELGQVTHEGDIGMATNDPEEGFRNADVVIVTVPAMIMESVAEKIFAHTDQHTVIGVVPGYGGSECAFAKCIERGNPFFGFERVPAIARMVKEGEIVKSTGYRNELHISAMPIGYVDQCCELIESIFDIPCKVIPNFLNLTMTPSNPILHTTRLRTIFKDYKPGVAYESVPLFYEEWDDASSELLLLCDEEVQRICRALPEIPLEYVKSLRVHYDSFTIDAMTMKIRSIEAFKGLKTPTIEKEGLLVPDFTSRYFTSDFSYGLAIILQVADLAEISVPHIREILQWYKQISGDALSFSYKKYGIRDRQSLIQFYLR